MTRTKIILVCGPWGSGSSAVAGFLSHAGVAAPGPYHAVPDPRTPLTYEMEAFRKALSEFVSEPLLRPTAPPATIVDGLTQFRDRILAAAMREGNVAEDATVLLKHPTAAFVLGEICEVFDTRIVGVLRPAAAIEATRRRRGWPEIYGAKGAQAIYGRLFGHIINASTPFFLSRYSDLLSHPQESLDALAGFVGIHPSEAQRKAARESLSLQSGGGQAG
jgi:hypothetical protein